ncbi:hypothetical protein FNF29_00295 [Cafeteria roenbergensis]|uniref:Uncharacterized protein n=1 Tax=Cafeteria roenbergensis TaxID=33653 RepID=A0A5A8D154_CAFRO|nr:hypothetical protein FNF31_06445 [Cafeteria roenbergensis]KAA0157721.1 hypothetical protein FNF29_00295 [Cafeteria roenbergensis]KAA0161658.1 hypothetical protein FNF28_04962 [Cafeteria roenbergensis]|eukprot:KAA0157721.1 hypothetical protein FNF29_00295 [Cafeteria roenbergensis]
MSDLAGAASSSKGGASRFTSPGGMSGEHELGGSLSGVSAGDRSKRARASDDEGDMSHSRRPKLSESGGDDVLAAIRHQITSDDISAPFGVGAPGTAGHQKSRHLSHSDFASRGHGLSFGVPIPGDESVSPMGLREELPKDGQASSRAMNRGRWTKAEHEAFVAALRVHGQVWKLVQEQVGTRDIVQVRTHAQKYFQRLAKEGKPRPAPGGDVFATSGSFHDNGARSAPGGEPAARPTPRPGKKKSTRADGSGGKARLPSRTRPGGDDAGDAAADSFAAGEDGLSETPVDSEFSLTHERQRVEDDLARTSTERSQYLVQCLSSRPADVSLPEADPLGEPGTDSVPRPASSLPASASAVEASPVPADKHGASGAISIKLRHCAVPLPSSVASRMRAAPASHQPAARAGGPLPGHSDETLALDPATAAVCSSAVRDPSQMDLALKRGPRDVYCRIGHVPASFGSLGQGAPAVGDFLVGVGGLCMAGLDPPLVRRFIAEAMGAVCNATRQYHGDVLRSGAHRQPLGFGLALHVCNIEIPANQTQAAVRQIVEVASMLQNGFKFSVPQLSQLVMLHAEWIMWWVNLNSGKAAETGETAPPLQEPSEFSTKVPPPLALYAASIAHSTTVQELQQLQEAAKKAIEEGVEAAAAKQALSQRPPAGSLGPPSPPFALMGGASSGGLQAGDAGQHGPASMPAEFEFGAQHSRHRAESDASALGADFMLHGSTRASVHDRSGSEWSAGRPMAPTERIGPLNPVQPPSALAPHGSR